MDKKRKRTTKDREPPRGRDDIPESARILRELYERGMAEVAERRKVDPDYR